MNSIEWQSSLDFLPQEIRKAEWGGWGSAWCLRDIISPPWAKVSHHMHCQESLWSPKALISLTAPKRGIHATLLIEVVSAESSDAHLGSFSSFFSQAGFWDALQLLVIVLPPPYDNFLLSWNCLILGSLGSSLFSSSLCICQREMKCCWMWRTQIS